MDWEIDFISQSDFKSHIRNTISCYGEKMQSYDLRKFNSNLVDPIKLIFDKFVYGRDWEEIVSDEIFRQRDKANNNEIGYFHQNIFKYIKNCHVPTEGWDVICDTKYLGKNTRIFVEVKNKHNTMNSSSSEKTYTKMQKKVAEEKNCFCFLVEVIAKSSQDIAWQKTVDKQSQSNQRIRRVSIDKFYEIVTGQSDAFLKICMELPKVIQEILKEESSGLQTPRDTVFEELANQVGKRYSRQDSRIIAALFIMAFYTYMGFSSLK